MQDVPSKQKILDIFEKGLGGKDSVLLPEQVAQVMRILAPSWSKETNEGINELVRSTCILNNNGAVTCYNLVDWLFAEAPTRTNAKAHHLWRLPPHLHDDTSGDRFVQTSFALQLHEFASANPYLTSSGSSQPHPLSYWYSRCRDCFEARKFPEAQEHLRRVQAGVETDRRQVSEAFKRFDIDSSGHLDAEELQYMCAYLGWAMETSDFMDIDQDGRITLPDFQLFVGRMGGVQKLFEQRRLRIGTSRRDVCDQVGLSVGARVRSHFYAHGQKSRSWREAQVLKVRVQRHYGKASVGPVTYGVLLEFGFGKSKRWGKWRATQVVPPSWVLSSVDDAETATACREIGLLDEDQSFWSLLVPDSELQALQRLTSCQREALRKTRDHSTKSHLEALPKVLERLKPHGWGDRELNAVLAWVQDLATICVHVHLDKMGKFMETDEFYRSQFETKTSCGAGSGDQQNMTRKRWETELWGGAYDGCKDFERAKYGALNVLNDYRGVYRARGYGDSYLVLKDVRLRTTFASTDSGGLRGNRLGVLDKYGHVLQEYTDDELTRLVRVAMAASTPEAHDTMGFYPELLRGPTYDSAKDWVTIGFPHISSQEGCFYFEFTVEKTSQAAQVGLVSSAFQRTPHSPSNEGVGDDCYGWAVDGANAGRWHNGSLLPWKQSWKIESNRTLKDDVVVGVAVDFEKRELYFSTDGVWDLSKDGERAIPAFDSEYFPDNVALYPAISLKGRATINFGPGFKYSAPPRGAFRKWLNTPETVVRIDKPNVGDESAMRIYKEIQVHGEVHLGRNVQRLVADRKYIDQPKSQRSLGLRISGAGLCDGTYKRTGVHNRQPLYKHTTSEPCIFFDVSTQSWVMSPDGLLERQPSYFAAKVDDGGDAGPPRLDWCVPPHMKGSVPEAAFREALKSKGYEDIEPLVSALRLELEDGTAWVCKERVDVTLATELPKYKHSAEDEKKEWTCEGEWQRGLGGTTIVIGGGTVSWSDGRTDPVVLLSPTTCEITMSGVLYTATLEKEGQQLTMNDGTMEIRWTRVAKKKVDETSLVWDAAIDVARKHVLAENSLGECLTVGTSHPYEAKTIEWREEHTLKSSSGLAVLFYSSSCTYDGCAEWRVFSGGLRRAAAGAGARVEVAAPGGSDKVWGTVVEKISEEDVWKVRLDRRPAEGTAPEAAWPAVGHLIEARKDGDAETWALASVVEVKGDDKFLIAWCSTSGDEAPWACSRCSFFNPGTSAICEMCEFPQAESKGTDETKETCEKDLAEIRAPVAKETTSLAAIRPCDSYQLDTWLTSGAKHLARSAGKFYYELKLEGDFFFFPQIGWLSEEFGERSYDEEEDDLPGVGDDELGWSCDGVRNKKWHNGELGDAEWPRNWQPQDVIGLAIDMDADGPTGKMRFSLNGEWVEAASMNFSSESPLYPAVSMGGQFVMHILKDTWKFSPPDSAYEPWGESGIFTRPERVKEKTLSSVEQGTRDLDDLPRYAAIAGKDAECFALCYENPSSVQVRYEGKAGTPDEQGYYPDMFVGDELVSLCLDRSTPLMPIVVEKFRGCGPAQKQEVHEGWRFDLVSTLSGVSRDVVSALFDGMGGIEKWDSSQSLETLMNTIFGDIDETLRRLNGGIGKLSEVTLVFCKGCTSTQVSLLPEAIVSYSEDQKVGDEIKELNAGDEKANSQLQVAGFFAESGPAYVAGVRHGWLLDVRATVAKNPEKLRSEKELLETPGDLLSMSGITVVFVHPTPSPEELFCGSGTGVWRRIDVPGDTATFTFRTDGDGADSPDKRWGVHCMLMPKECEITQETFDKIVSKIMDLELKGKGVKGAPEVQRDSWDENRLRALCARHGWDFEWMTEDGEGRRRARERLRLREIPLVRPSAPDPSLPDGSKGIGTS